MAFPKITVAFKALANASIKNLEDGIVALIVKNATATDASVTKLDSLANAPVTLTASQLDYLTQAFKGASKVLLVVSPDVNKALTKLEAYKFNYVAFPEGVSADYTAMVTWIKNLRDNKDLKRKAVVANTAGDNEGVINFTTSGIHVGSTVYTAAQFTARIAGLIAGTGPADSVTFAVLPEVTDIDVHLSETDAGTKIDVGELILYHDGEKVKIARGVNSLVTITGDKTEIYKKIKMVEIMDTIHDDIKATSQDSFIGKMRNNYANKLLLCNAINNYFDDLADEEILEVGSNKCEIDIDATTAYIKSKGVDISTLKASEIKEYNTGDKVFLSAKIVMIDCMEEITMKIAV